MSLCVLIFLLNAKQHWGEYQKKGTAKMKGVLLGIFLFLYFGWLAIRALSGDAVVYGRPGSSRRVQLERQSRPAAYWTTVLFFLFIAAVGIAGVIASAFVP
jgi:hypothetical protein